MERIKKAASELKQKFIKSDLEKAIHAIIKSSEPPLKTAYYFIADRTILSEDCKAINKILWEYLKPEEKDCFKILRAFQLVEALVKFGSFSFVVELSSSSQKFRSFIDYFPDGKSIEQCTMVREIVRRLLNLFAHEILLENERDEARKQREKTIGFSSINFIEGKDIEMHENFKAQELTNSSGLLSSIRYDHDKLPVTNGFSYGSPEVNDYSNDYLARENLKNQEIYIEIQSNPGVASFIRTLDNEKKIDLPALTPNPESKTIESNQVKIMQNKDQFPKHKTELFGFPIKSSSNHKNYNEKSDISTPEPNNANKIQSNPSIDGKLFGIPLKKAHMPSHLHNKSEINSNMLDFDLLSLNLDLEIPKAQNDQKTSLNSKQENPKNLFLSNEDIKTEQKSENNNIFGNLNMKNTHKKSVSNINEIRLIKDSFDFNSTFPLIKTEISSNSQVLNNLPNDLEASLMNIDDLTRSLSKSVAPFNTRLIRS
ncbi:hypothetical protein SteCoe_10112 [Stentor coeruleus]|uniref:ENTH domain-containing protein n=1 Tax=Stentor coeruleus TaxID=5963 RepID=A0A1R2CG93_9CILI|nr:hypothetical protein SteCoe_10112 [Stentor coeruleus]